MTLILIGVGAWLAAVILMAVILTATEWHADEPEDEERDPDYRDDFFERWDDDEVEKDDAWGRTPDWNWPRGFGGNPRYQAWDARCGP